MCIRTFWYIRVITLTCDLGIKRSTVSLDI